MDKIPKSHDALYDILIDKHEYFVISKVKDTTFSSFLKYFVENQVPDFDITNILEFHDLNEEFGILEDYLSLERSIFLLNISYLTENKPKSMIDTSSIEAKISENLDEYITNFSKEMAHIQFNSLYNIFFNPRKKLENHDNAYEFIIQNEKLYSLIPSLDANKMKKYQRESIFRRDEHFGFLTSNFETYILKLEQENEELKSKLKNISEEMDKSIEKQEVIKSVDINKITIEFDGKKENRFNGLIRYLTNINKEKDKKFSINDIIKVEASSINDNFYIPENVLQLDKECYFHSKNIENSYIIFNFGKFKLLLTHYSISSRKFHGNSELRNWKIQGSNDHQTWKTLDKVEQDKSLVGLGASNTFEVKLNKDKECFQYIKLKITDVNNYGSYYLIFQSIEFFGTLTVQ